MLDVGAYYAALIAGRSAAEATAIATPPSTEAVTRATVEPVASTEEFDFVPPPCPVFDPIRLPIGRVFPARSVIYVDPYEAEASRDRVALLENRAIPAHMIYETRPTMSAVQSAAERAEREADA